MKTKVYFVLMLTLALFVHNSYAQEKTLSGVISEEGVSFPGVSVIIQGTQFGTQSDAEGKYSLKVKVGDVLVFSLVGYKEVIYKVGAESIHNVSMVLDDKILGEVVVLAYGQVKTRNEISGNVVAVKGDVVKHTPLASPDQALQGRIAGLQMSTSSGTPGAKQYIRIRGRNSMTATNEPLYVIDGVPMYDRDFSGGNEGATKSSTSMSLLSTINSEDIESITVLKDAGTTAVYGARGTNGVILITTKKGKAGSADTKFSFSSSVGFQNNAVKGPVMLSGKQKEELFLDAVFNTYGEKFGFGREDVADFAEKNFSTNANYGKWISSKRPDNNWGEIIKNKDAVITSLNFSATGGGVKNSFYASLGQDKMQGTVLGSDFVRISGALNFMQKLTDKIEFNTSFKVSNTKQNGLLEGGGYFSNPNIIKLLMNPWVSPYNKDGSYYLPKSGLHNVLYSVKNDINRNDVTRALNSTSLTYDIIDDLKFTSSLGLDYSLSEHTGYKNPVHGDGQSVGGSATKFISQRFNYVAQNGFDYRFSLDGDHRFDVKLLYEFQKSKRTILQGYGEVLPIGFTSLGTAAANKDADFEYVDEIQMAYVGIVNYNYLNRYLLDLTTRRESSSKFTERTGWFYSVGGAWNLHKEKFMDDQTTFSTLRLRASYGTNGNSQINPNQYIQRLSVTSYDDEGGFIPNQIGGAIGWEKQEKLDVGFALGFLDERITLNAAYFKSNTRDLLYNKALSKLSGFSSRMINMGSLENYGYEAELNIDIFRSDDFNLSIGGNIGTVENKIIKMPLDEDGKPQEIFGSFSANLEGHPIAEWYLPTYAGVDPQNGNALWYDKDNNKINDYNKAEKRFQGASPLPKYSGAFNLHTDYKGFFVDALLAFSGGNKVYEDWTAQTNGVGPSTLMSYNGVVELMDRWTKPGQVTDVPKPEIAPSGGNASATDPSTRFLYDGDYLRLRNVSVGYNFTSVFAKELKLDALSISLIGTNLLTWVKDSRLNYDPEIDPTGFTSLAVPPIKSVVFSFNVKF